MGDRHVLLVTFPAQGHINPSLQFAKRLVAMGIHVTFATSVRARRRMADPTALPAGLTLSSFSDGYDDGFDPTRDGPTTYMTSMRTKGSEALHGIISESHARGRRPVTRVVYTPFLPWAADVARDRRIPRALLWIQPATVMAIYYHYFNGYSDRIVSIDGNEKIEFPGIQLSFSERDLPSILLPSSLSSDVDAALLRSFEEHLQALDSETKKPRVLVNTFDALEADGLKAIGDYELIGIGPLIPPAFLDGRDPSDIDDKSFGGNLFRASVGCKEWLDSKQESSVVYVSFGSLLNLPKEQMEEIAKGLRESGRPFLWVIRASTDEDDSNKLSLIEELIDEEKGKIVEWCSQLEVLTHRSLGCFVTHCGWNSTLESISCGVPVVAFPHWTDQGTNAKLIEDVWRSGVRVRADGDGMVESGEIKRCIEEVMDGGERSREFRESAAKWKALAAEAMGENGSSNRNLRAFLEQVET